MTLPDATTQAAGGRQEWRQNGHLAVTAMIGITGPAAYSYCSGLFMEPMTNEFGWSRTEFASSMTMLMLLGVLTVPPAGRLLDRYGPRKMALAGILPFVVAFSLLGTANGHLWHWWLLSGLLALGLTAVMPAIWIAGVVRSFQVARGSALAVALAGIGVATAIWPILAARYIEGLGWRLAFPAIALTWAAVILPLTFFLFKPKTITASAPTEAMAPRPSVWPILKSGTFLGLLGAGGLFAAAQLAMISHFVPILRGQGVSIPQAAMVAAVVGVSSIVGRLGTGFLLDMLPTRPIAIASFLLLVPVAALLYLAHGSMPALVVAAVFLGLAAGSEMDVLTFVAARRFAPQLFGSAYSSLQAGLAILSSLGPLIAGKMFDIYGSYDRFLIVAVVLDLVAMAIMAMVLKSRQNQPITEMRAA